MSVRKPGNRTAAAAAVQVPVGETQEFEWGDVRWFERPSGHGRVGPSFGLARVKPFSRQASHTHFQEEQYILILSGRGRHIVDGVVYEAGPGDMLHIPPGSLHEMDNLGQDEFVFLATFLPTGVQDGQGQALPGHSDKGQRGTAVLRSLGVAERIRATAQVFSSVSRLSALLCRLNGSIAVGAETLPAFCRVVRAVQGGEAMCTKSLRRGARLASRGRTAVMFECCSGVMAVAAPVTVWGKVVACAVSGHAYLREPCEETEQSVLATGSRLGVDPAVLRECARSFLNVAKARMFVIAESFRAGVVNEAEMALEVKREREARLRHGRVLREVERRTELERALREAEMRLLRSSADPDLLFTCLRAAVDMATVEGAQETAEVVTALSNVLRYNIARADGKVTVDELAAYIVDYVRLCRAKFGDRLRLSLEVEPGIGGATIPLIVVQPVVHSAVVNSLEPKPSLGTLSVGIHRAGLGRLSVRVCDDGVGYAEKVGPVSGGGWAGASEAGRPRTGLSVALQALRYFYEDDYTFDVRSLAGLGTEVKIEVPYRELPSKL